MSVQTVQLTAAIVVTAGSTKVEALTALNPTATSTAIAFSLLSQLKYQALIALTLWTLLFPHMAPPHVS